MGQETGTPGANSPSDLMPFGVELSLAVFNRATLVARGLFSGSDSVVILVKDGKAWRSRYETDALPSRDHAADTVIASGEMLWIADATRDPRFADNPIVTGPPFLRSYIGAPIKLADGSTPGVLAVVSGRPQPFDKAKAMQLQALADFVADEWARAQIADAHAKSSQELMAARTTLQALFNSIPTSVVLTDTDLRILAATKVWATNLGLQDSDYIGRTLFEAAPKTYERWRSVYARCLAGEAISGRKVPVDLGDKTVWMQTELTPWRDSSGEVGGMMIAAEDISEMVKSLEQSERSEQRLNIALDVADVHVWELDYVNRELIKAGAEETFFETPQTYQDLYKDIYGAIDPRDQAQVREAWERHINEGAPYRPQYRIARPDGREVWVEGSVKLFADETGKPQRVVGAMQNVTAQREGARALVAAKEEAEAANRAKSSFLATMSHEIRTPLNGVLGMAQAMSVDQLSDIQRDRLDVIRQSGESLLAILNDLLDLSKIEAGKLELESIEFDLDEIARGAHATFTALANKKGLSFALDVEQARGVYLGDPTRMRQVMYNLISNALKFTQSGEIRVFADHDGANLSIRVTDTGIGMTSEVLDTLFTKFNQADASTTRKFGGTGLGLAICKQLAELMGGSIEVSSVEGEGSAFVFSVPALRLGDAKPRYVAEVEPIDEQPRPLSLRVLSAEDNTVNQLVLKTLLHQIGVDPTMVENGQAAVDAWEASDWDAILMDVQMPVMDGPTATRLIRRREAELGRARTPIIALTANAMSHQIAEYLASGMDGHVTKPIEALKLFQALEAALDMTGPTEGESNVA